MKTLTLKLPEGLEARLTTFARQTGQSRSEIVRRAIAQYISGGNKAHPGSFLDLAKDLAGTIDGPPDLSTDKSHLDDYGK